MPDDATRPAAAPRAAPDPVADAFDALIRALSEAALADEAAYDRATSFRAAAIGMRDRWRSGENPTRRATAPRPAKEG